ncbi:MAG TPA: 2-C-methyl-D-erythritol 4-phosphate cytidylyltransferase [Thermoleophilaceae bacterium]
MQPNFQLRTLAILAGAGAGDRLGADAPKAFIRCAGRELWRWSADVLLRTCDRVVFAVPPEWIEDEDPGIERVAGGAARSESVRNALAVVPDADVVVIHDAARPFVTDELVRECIAAVEAGADGAVAAARVTDTVKEADADGRVVRTLDRSRLWSIQTPQAFRGDVLRKALESASESVASATDDASLVESLGGQVRIVEASQSNFKITYPEDLARAEALLC